MKQAKADALHYFLRVVYLCVGLLIMAVGVGFSIRADLGTSPISSVPYTLSLLCAPLTVGEITILMHCVFILIQILLLRRRYELLQLLQLPVAVVFGVLTDFGVWLTEQIPCDAYWQQWILCLVGVVLVAVGVSIEVTAQVVTLAGEGLVLAICKAFPKLKFGTMKVAFDVTLVVIRLRLRPCRPAHARGRARGHRRGRAARRDHRPAPQPPVRPVCGAGAACARSARHDRRRKPVFPCLKCARPFAAPFKAS